MQSSKDNLVSWKVLEPVSNSKHLVNPLSNPSCPLPVITPSEFWPQVTKINQAYIANKRHELPKTNIVNKLFATYLLLGPEMQLKSPTTREGKPREITLHNLDHNTLCSLCSVLAYIPNKSQGPSICFEMTKATCCSYL